MRRVFTVLLLLVFFCSCKKQLERLNDNPNGADPGTTSPNLVLSTVLTTAGEQYVNLGYGDFAGVMQHTQNDGATGPHNEYDWGGDYPWTPWYDILRNNKYVYDRSVALGFPFQQGISLTMKSMLFGLITDMWGDAPYSQALEGDSADAFPAYDSQQSIYMGILADLQTANTLLSQPAYAASPGAADVYYNGNPVQWRKLANSLALRYYLRISDKLPDVAKAGIEKIVADPTTYPIITSASDDATMGFAGSNANNSWPNAVAYNSDSSHYRQTKLCATFVNALESLNDPRLGIWANKVQIFLDVQASFPAHTDEIVDTMVAGENRQVRYLSPDVLASKGLTVNDINQDVSYVGLPVAIVGEQVYNLGPDPGQAAHNPHVSWLNSMYMGANGPLLKARLMSAAEVHFILAEAALKGWAAGDAQTQYNLAIQSSFAAWGLASLYAAYIAQPLVAFNGTVQQLITQKWIASWTAATESWFDWRRTGYPVLAAGPHAKGPVLPVRVYYPLAERNLNWMNVEAAENTLLLTPYSGYGADATNNYKNSAWSKPWIAQGTGKPW